ncbi:hypothetical protein AGLY_005279 [Aphis glycines]|uniref:Uncharacterized protein n=1 Tax=Aphis glycines TaxID=307491 RepID=A0A6G0TX66_APHGL|nr:hypothetical protein AGLY_005279 [Aphis glycines]
MTDTEFNKRNPTRSLPRCIQLLDKIILGIGGHLVEFLGSYNNPIGSIEIFEEAKFENELILKIVFHLSFILKFSENVFNDVIIKTILFNNLYTYNSTEQFFGLSILYPSFNSLNKSCTIIPGYGTAPKVTNSQSILVKKLVCQISHSLRYLPGKFQNISWTDRIKWKHHRYRTFILLDISCSIGNKATCIVV